MRFFQWTRAVVLWISVHVRPLRPPPQSIVIINVDWQLQCECVITHSSPAHRLNVDVTLLPADKYLYRLLGPVYVCTHLINCRSFIPRSFFFPICGRFSYEFFYVPFCHIICLHLTDTADNCQTLRTQNGYVWDIVLDKSVVSVCVHVKKRFLTLICRN